MDMERFDRLMTSLSAAGTRRGLLRLGASLPLAGALAALLGEASEAGRQHRRSARHRHRTGNGKDNRKGQRSGNGNGNTSCATTGQTPKTGTRSNCCQGLVTDAAGRCAEPTGGGLGSGTPCLPSGADLQTAIDAASPGDTLTLCAGTFFDIAATITKNLTLVGAGSDQTILNNDTSCICAVIEVAKGATVTVQGLAIGKRDVSYWGFVNYGTLTLLEVTITGGGAPANGAGIYNEGTLTLGAGASIRGLSVSNSGAGIYNDGGVVRLAAGSSVTSNHAVLGSGGGIYNYYGTLTLEAGSNMTKNLAPNGGGIYNDYGTLLLQDGSSVTGNGAGSAGGIYNNGGTATLEAGSSVKNNTANNDAGGIYNDGTLTLKTGSSVTGNTTLVGGGGGIYNDGTLTLQDGSSVTGNTVGGTGGNGGGILNTGIAILEAGAKVTGNTVENLDGLGGDGGGIFNASGSVTLGSTDIVTNNDPNNCSGSPAVPSCIG